MATKIQMKAFLLTLFIFVSLIVVNAQKEVPQQAYYWVYFSDKNCHVNLIHHPEQFLSAKSINRREKQQIKVDEADLPICTDYIENLKKAGYTIVTQSKWLNAVAIDLFQKSKPKGNYIKKIAPARQYYLDGFIRSEADSSKTLNQKKMYAPKINQLYGAASIQLNMLGSACLHQNNYWGEGIDIAIFDAGFRNADKVQAFQQVFNEGRVLSTYDFVEDDSTVFDEGNSPHGTVVWSAMAAQLAEEYSGAAPLANYHLLKTEDTGSETLVEEFNWIEAAEYADSAGVDIINSSLGYSLFEDSLENHTYADMDGNTTPVSIAADIAAAKGIVVVTSAGNSGTKPWTYITAPADADSILAVGSVDAARNKSDFSSFGPSSDGDVKPDVAAMGSKTIVVKPNGDLDEAYGTSMSSPLIAGMAACLWQKFPDKNNMEIIELIKQSSSQYKQPDTLLGYGIPDFCAAQLSSSLSEVEDLVWVYPNPFAQNIFVTVFNLDGSNQVGAHSVALYDLNGKLIEEQRQLLHHSNAQTFTFSGLEQLSTGIYYLQYSTDRAIHHYKIFKLNSN